MKILQLTAENFKRLTAVEISPEGNLIEITGRNGHGKTSVLDAIWTALKGKAVAPTDPIHDGAERAMIRLDLGELVVTRQFKRAKDGYTTSVTVESGDGAKFGSPQAILDSLVGSLSLDPLAFVRMSAKEQFDALKGLVAFDFDALERDNKADYDERTAVNRRAKEARTRAEGITIQKDSPRKKIDTDALVASMAEAAEHNAKMERALAHRDRMVREVDDCRAQVATLMAQADALKKRAASLESEIGAFEIDSPIDVSEIRAKIEAAKAHNEAVEAFAKREDYVADAEIAEEESRAITERMEARNRAKAEAIQNAKLPVDGLDLDDGRVLLNGHAFGDASSAEQLRASMAIAAAMNPKLRIIRCQDGSLLDDDSMRMVAEFADTNDMQVWMERVDSSGRIGFVIEDGHLKTPQLEAAE